MTGSSAVAAAELALNPPAVKPQAHARRLLQLLGLNLASHLPQRLYALS